MGAKGGWVQPDSRAGRWARREARRRQWEGLRANWLLFLLMFALAASAGLAYGWFFGGWWGGFVAGAFTAVGLAMPLHLSLLMSGSAPQVMGAFAEEQVSEAIQRGLVGSAQAFDRLAFSKWDLDHLVVAPSAALAIETKWRAAGWDVEDLSDDRLRDAVHQVTGSVRSIRHFLASSQIGLPLDVERLVVLCGPRTSGDVGVGSVDGCPVVRLRELRPWIDAWCRDHDRAGLDKAAFAAGCANIASYLDQRDAYDAGRNREHFFVLHGALAPMQSAWEGILAFLAAVLLSFGALASAWLGVALMAIVLGGGVVALRRLGRRAALLGWSIAASLAVLVGAVVQSI